MFPYNIYSRSISSEAIPIGLTLLYQSQLIFSQILEPDDSMRTYVLLVLLLLWKTRQKHHLKILHKTAQIKQRLWITCMLLKTFSDFFKFSIEFLFLFYSKFNDEFNKIR